MSAMNLPNRFSLKDSLKFWNVLLKRHTKKTAGTPLLNQDLNEKIPGNIEVLLEC